MSSYFNYYREELDKVQVELLPTKSGFFSMYSTATVLRLSEIKKRATNFVLVAIALEINKF
ncbi:hypothetical protein [Nostoc sp. MG11]|uniref:hypothetical protein n=1 Tax=Nostoc sp. MG11 TaxID=2721166 RepID=UPI0018677776|nr:hypothetical protein [Nostoc sp. MG11]